MNTTVLLVAFGGYLLALYQQRWVVAGGFLGLIAYEVLVA